MEEDEDMLNKCPWCGFRTKSIHKLRAHQRRPVCSAARAGKRMHDRGFVRVDSDTTALLARSTNAACWIETALSAVHGRGPKQRRLVSEAWVSPHLVEAGFDLHINGPWKWVEGWPGGITEARQMLADFIGSLYTDPEKLASVKSTYMLGGFPAVRALVFGYRERALSIMRVVERRRAETDALEQEARNLCPDLFAQLTVPK